MTYLAQKGIHPVKRLSGGKLSYICPLPDHKETKPSFIVFTQADFENFKCFGCGATYHIIHLVSKMEGISYREAVNRLSEGVEVTAKDEIIFSAKEIEKHALNKSSWPIEQQMEMINFYCRLYLDGVGQDEGECSIIDKLWGKIDGSLIEFDLSKIEEISQYLPDALKLRRERFERINRETMAEKYKKEHENDL